MQLLFGLKCWRGCKIIWKASHLCVCVCAVLLAGWPCSLLLPRWCLQCGTAHPPAKSWNLRWVQEINCHLAQNSILASEQWWLKLSAISPRTLFSAGDDYLKMIYVIDLSVNCSQSSMCCDPLGLPCDVNSVANSDRRQPASSKKARSPGQQGQGALVRGFQPQHSADWCFGRCFLVNIPNIRNWIWCRWGTLKQKSSAFLSFLCFFSAGLVHLSRSIWFLGGRLDTWSMQTNRWSYRRLDTLVNFF